jgi:hypothetical protein
MPLSRDNFIRDCGAEDNELIHELIIKKLVYYYYHYVL